MVRHALRPKLNAAVHETVGTFDFILQAKLEISEFPGCGQKFVVRLFSIQLTSDNRALLDAPVGGVALPAVQRFAVKNRDRVSRVKLKRLKNPEGENQDE